MDDNVTHDADPGGRDRVQEIEELAYALWVARGCPIGSAEADWFEAERQLTDAAKAPDAPADN